MSLQENVLVTVDYETFGDGSGCLDTCVVNPAERIALIVEQHGGRATFYVEALEFICMERWSRANNNTKLFEKIQRVKLQLQSLYNRGHDIQVHIHPQWHNANEFSNEKWNLDFTKWRIGNCTREEIQEMFQESISWIRKVLNETESWNPTSFRAGGWCVQPSKNIVSVLEQFDFFVDTTVAPNCSGRGKHTWYDFRVASEKPWWRISDEVISEGNSKITEVPIATSPCLGVLTAIEKLKRGKNHGPKGCVGSLNGPQSKTDSWINKIRKLLPFSPQMLDYCLLTTNQMKATHKSWVEIRGGKMSEKKKSLPVVSIGHNKTFGSEGEVVLDEYLQWSRETRSANICTMSSWVKDNLKLDEQ